MRAVRRAVAVALSTFALGPASVDAAEVSPADLVTDPEKFDGARVTVLGTVSQVREQGPDIDAQGRSVPVYTFFLGAERSTVLVVAAGKPACAAGAVAIVEGVFIRRGHPRVHADRVRC